MDFDHHLGLKSNSMNYRTSYSDRSNWNNNFEHGSGERRLAHPMLSRNASCIDIPPYVHSIDFNEKFSSRNKSSFEKFCFMRHMLSIFSLHKSGNKPARRLLLLISLNTAYSTAELLIGLFSGRVGLISDAVHLTFGCGLLTFSLFSMSVSNEWPDRSYTYGYKRLEVLSAFTNALFLLFMAFSLAVEALHALIQDESEHKHYLIVSAVTNLFVNLIGVWFFRNYARIDMVYRNAEDMNYHSICLHVLADSIRSAGLILASWLLTLGVENAEFLCLGMVSLAVFVLAFSLFRKTGSVLLQVTPSSLSPSALNKCMRQIISHDGVHDVPQARFWELVPGHVIGSISMLVKEGADEHGMLQYVHGLYHESGVQDLTVQVDYA